MLLWDAGMSYREITDRTGQPMESVGVLLHHARERLARADDALH
jgi:DNA-directed RNA polymerase specialized sigma24 family protein